MTGYTVKTRERMYTLHPPRQVLRSSWTYSSKIGFVVYIANQQHLVRCACCLLVGRYRLVLKPNPCCKAKAAGELDEDGTRMGWHPKTLHMKTNRFVVWVKKE